MCRATWSTPAVGSGSRGEGILALGGPVGIAAILPISEGSATVYLVSCAMLLCLVHCRAALPSCSVVDAASEAYPGRGRSVRAV